MSWKAYEENCQGCRPCVIDPKTMKPLPEDSEIMRTVNAVWATATREEKEAFHNVTCNNSEEYKDVTLFTGLCGRIQEALKRN